MEDDISVQDKMRIVSDFILHAPPGEFNEVFNDVRELLKNDTLLKEGASGAFAKYNKDQLTPVRLENAVHQTVVSEYNDLGLCHIYPICIPIPMTALQYFHKPDDSFINHQQCSDINLIKLMFSHIWVSHKC